MKIDGHIGGPRACEGTTCTNDNHHFNGLICSLWPIMMVIRGIIAANSPDIGLKWNIIHDNCEFTMLNREYLVKYINFIRNRK